MFVFLGYFVGISVVVVLSDRGIALVVFILPRYVVDGNIVVVVSCLCNIRFVNFFFIFVDATQLVGWISKV